MVRRRFFDQIGAMNAYEHARHRGRWLRNAMRLIVVIDLAAVLLSTFRGLRSLDLAFNIIAYFSALVFLFEYAYRIVNAVRIGRWKRYLFSFMGLVDLICILPFFLPLFMEPGTDMALLVNFSKVFLTFKLVRYSQAFQMLGEILRSVRAQLQLVVAVSASFVVFASILMYYVERNAQQEVFSSVGEGFWWAVITMTTVGYGDIYPISPLGKFLAAFIALIGMGMIALPAGIISSAFSGRRKGEATGDKYCPHCGLRMRGDSCENGEDEEKGAKNLAE